MTTPREDLEEQLRDPDSAQEYGAEAAIDNFALTLRRTRRQLCMTQTRLAEDAGQTAWYIKAIEDGTADPSLRTVGRLFAALGLEVEIHLVPIGGVHD